MIDSVLKGTGNSRFLKSAVPAGTSWADALAMLQAGTFPIDFNGINTEGFQQVGTPLNKANLLKDATAAQIGLPSSATPNDMFNALAHAGDLHVWRKTVVNSQPVPEVPGSYTLGTAQSLHIATRTSTNSNRTSNITGVLASNEVAVDISGEVSLKDPATITLYPEASQTDTRSGLLSGYSYFMFPSSTVSSNNCAVAAPTDKIYYVASNVEFKGCGTYTYGETAVISAAQLVTGVPGSPAAPAGTTTTYPVSTNPNAYQEGDDAKEAGYTLGDAGRIVFYSGNDRLGFKYGDAITVSDDGKTIDIKNPSYQEWYGSNINNVTVMSGKFMRFTFHDNTDYETSNPVYFMPSTSKMEYDSDLNVSAVVQPVTGYAAIPAGTTIEYLGKLGDKARVQVVSYVGTGTYGSDHPNSLTFDFAPKVVMFLRGYKKGSTQFGHLTASNSNDNKVVTPESLATTYTRYNGFGGPFGSYAKKSEDGKTIFWYNEQPSTQGNDTGYTYYFLAIG